MKRPLFIVCLFLSVASAAFAAEGPFGLGLVVGEPTGVSLGYRLGKERMLQGTLAWDFTSPGGLTIAGDYLFLFNKALKIEKTPIPLYVGFGAKLTILIGSGTYAGSDFPFGVAFRVPLGVRWPFADIPLEAFLELVPGLRLVPDTAFDAGAGIGVRWYFKK